MKERVIQFIREIVIVFVVVVILLFVASKFGWTDTAIWDNAIGITLGWTVWKVIMILIESKNNKKN